MAANREVGRDFDICQPVSWLADTQCCATGWQPNGKNPASYISKALALINHFWLDNNLINKEASPTLSESDSLPSLSLLKTNHVTMNPAQPGSFYSNSQYFDCSPPVECSTRTSAPLVY